MADARYRFEIYPRPVWSWRRMKDERHWFLRLVAGNGEIVMMGETNGYHNKVDAEALAMTLRTVTASAKIVILEN